MVLFVCKKSGLDPQPIVTTLCMRTKVPNETGWRKLVQMMKFINVTKDDTLTLSAGEGATCLNWHIGASFAVHPDHRSHSGLAMKFREGRGCLISGLEKQKLNTDSSTIGHSAPILAKSAVDTIIPSSARLQCE